MGKKKPYYKKSTSINFLEFPYTMGFLAFSITVRNIWGIPCISHMMKYTVGWWSNGKNEPSLWERYEYKFPRLYPYHGFSCIFQYCGKCVGKPIHFSYTEVCHMMGLGWQTSIHILGKVLVLISQAFPIPWILLHFPVLWEMYGKTHAFLIWRSIS